ncbi:DUF4843 domain-containing protein [Butyricimonas synergistica]|uniref:DUF4843 domain-containing protein n=1 Tax=Butyricimonas synergistica TaxID=544644 RepID=UPI00037D1356|nr:DUF4843 domain-containing protein [Butyricimonas synergistica]
MKKIYVFILSVFLLGACSKEDIPMYNTVNYIQFTNAYKDSMEISFFFYGNAEQIEVPIHVEMLGNLFLEDQPFTVVLDKNLSTATEKHIELPEYYVFHKGYVRDTISLVLNNPGDERVRIVLAIPGNGSDILPGEPNYQYKIINLSNTVTIPEWWDEDVDKSFLGTYSAAKYQLLIEVTGEGDWTNLDASTRRAYALQLKYYLREMEDRGEPVLDDGVAMTVTVIG